MGLRIPAGSRRRPDDEWKRRRESVDLAEVIARFLGAAPGRAGSRGDRKWWRCPFHDDKNPSLSVRPKERHWRCFGCAAKGDVVEFVRRLHPELSFPEVIAFLTGEAPARPRRPAPAPRPELRKAERPEGWQAGVAELVAAAEARLWTPAGAEALCYLRGRCLAAATIRAARLGFLDGDQTPRGVAIPWREGDVFSMVNVRRPPGSEPKYMAIAGSRREGMYPGRDAIRPGRPLVVVEGELDALLLGQELGEMAGVVTLGSASMRPDAATLGAMLPASPWYIATDADAAGDGSAEGWPASARRVRPPSPYKDWTDARQNGVDLRRWWADLLAGRGLRRDARGEWAPELFTESEAAAWRWGPGVGDEAPGIVAPHNRIDRPENGGTLTSTDVSTRGG